MVVLSQQFNWKAIEDSLAHRYNKFGAPAKPIRLLAGLLILKQMFNKSDEVIVEEWRQNPYYQFLKARLIFNGAFHVIRRIWFISEKELKTLV